MTTSPSQAMGQVIHMVQQFLNLWQEGLKEVLEKEVQGQFLSRDHARDIFNASGRRAVLAANEAMALAAEIELEQHKSIAPGRPKLIVLEEHHE